MQLQENDPVALLLGQLNHRMDFVTREGDDRNQFNKAYSILSDEVELNGLPTLERAYHLLLVKGIRDRKGEGSFPDIDTDDRRGIVINSAHQKNTYKDLLPTTKDFEEFGEVFLPKKENKMNKGMAAIMLGQILAQQGLGSRSISNKESRQLKREPKMPLTEEEILRVRQLTGKDKKRYVKELKTKYEF